MAANQRPSGDALMARVDEAKRHPLLEVVAGGVKACLAPAPRRSDQAGAGIRDRSWVPIRVRLTAVASCLCFWREAARQTGSPQGPGGVVDRRQGTAYPIRPPALQVLLPK